jgi:hypothetical protein
MYVWGVECNHICVYAIEHCWRLLISHSLANPVDGDGILWNAC